ncbi:GDSL-type esterase/lipase family protein [Bacillus sp. 1P06AnD]|uniref:DUF459 domain-containing protein n=1 Tax=Bacillus sp. 1P06AnD TaxID=3132208 RepID=UPI0039A3C3C9
MIKKAILLLIACSLLSACSLSDLKSMKSSSDKRGLNLEEKDQVYEKYSPVNLNITAIGDSLTEGVGDHTKKGGYPSVLIDDLEKEPAIKDIHLTQNGKRGLTSTELIPKIHKKGAVHSIKNADIVMITIGGNDVMDVVRNHYTHIKVSHFNEGLDTYEKNVKNVLSFIREENKDADIYLIGLYNPFQKWLANIDEFEEVLDKWNDTSKKIVDTYKNAYFVSISDLFAKNTENLIYEEDYFHPNTDGYEKIAGAVFDSLKKHSIPAIKEEAGKKGE